MFNFVDSSDWTQQVAWKLQTAYKKKKKNITLRPKEIDSNTKTLNC